MFGEIRFRFTEKGRNFVKIHKLGPRDNDNAPIALVELVGSTRDVDVQLAKQHLDSLMHKKATLESELANSNWLKIKTSIPENFTELSRMELTKSHPYWDQIQAKREYDRIHGNILFLDGFIQRLSTANGKFTQAEASRQAWFEWAQSRNVELKRKALQQFYLRTQVFTRLGGNPTDAELKKIIEKEIFHTPKSNKEGASYHGGPIRLSWKDYATFRASFDAEDASKAVVEPDFQYSNLDLALVWPMWSMLREKPREMTSMYKIEPLEHERDAFEVLEESIKQPQ